MISWLRFGWDRIAHYLPIALLGLLALGTYWLVRSAPAADEAGAPTPVRRDPDYRMENFSIKTFDGAGHLRSELSGSQARHYPQTDVVEIDAIRLRSFNEHGYVTVATARKGISNADGSEVQLIGDARIVRDAGPALGVAPLPRLSLRSEFLHAFVRDERIKSYKPVEILRGNDRITADTLDYDNLTQVVLLQGRVRGLLLPPTGRSP